MVLHESGVSGSVLGMTDHGWLGCMERGGRTSAFVG